MSSLARTSIALALSTGALVAGCGAAPPRAEHLGERNEDGGLQLSLRRHDGEVIELADQRGAPVLLFFFATYDGASTASSRDVARFTRDALDTVVIAVALQANAPTFTAAYVESEAPPYTVAYDADEVIVSGRSELGSFEAIPMFVMIDARGREVSRHVGYASLRQLQRWHDEAVSRGGLATSEP